MEFPRRIGPTEAQNRLFPSNPQLARAISRIGPRSYQEFVIDYWNQNEGVPEDFGSALLSVPAVNAAWRRQTA